MSCERVFCIVLYMFMFFFCFFYLLLLFAHGSSNDTKCNLMLLHVRFALSVWTREITARLISQHTYIAVTKIVHIKFLFRMLHRDRAFFDFKNGIYRALLNATTFMKGLEQKSIEKEFFLHKLVLKHQF